MKRTKTLFKTRINRTNFFRTWDIQNPDLLLNLGSLLERRIIIQLRALDVEVCAVHD